ncbi:hypothetical protein IFM89_030781 [Coptis chinensis]|uniref:GRPD C-terminal domain-containing protein n=1 Tax=Coptis chinensis TaxID=261450 RepID=A0A835M4Z3_9MAGN|nr:hypothetical protein IFM89_030781 [Coptis chinensis]
MLATLDDPFTRFLEPEKFKSLRVHLLFLSIQYSARQSGTQGALTGNHLFRACPCSLSNCFRRNREVIAISSSSESDLGMKIPDVPSNGSVRLDIWILGYLMMNYTKFIYFASMYFFFLVEIKLDYEPKYCQTQKNEGDFMTAVEFSKSDPYGKAIALFNLKSGVLKVDENWFALSAITLAFILSDIWRKESSSAFISARKNSKVVSLTESDDVESGKIQGTFLEKDELAERVGIAFGGMNLISKSSGRRKPYADIIRNKYKNGVDFLGLLKRDELYMTELVASQWFVPIIVAVFASISAAAIAIDHTRFPRRRERIYVEFGRSVDGEGEGPVINLLPHSLLT